MPANPAGYRADVTDKQQNDLERFNDHSAIRIHGIDGEDVFMPAYDLRQKQPTARSSNAVLLSGHIIGAWNDRSWT